VNLEGLPNICFTHDGEVRLINFDRAVYHDWESVPAQFFGPYMYKCDPSLTVSDLDWKQLGLLTLCVSNQTMHQTKVTEKDVKQFCGDEFLHQLQFTLWPITIIFTLAWYVGEFLVWLFK